MSEGPFCGCTRITYDPADLGNGSKAERWTCAVQGGCGREFVPKARAEQALATVTAERDEAKAEAERRKEELRLAQCPNPRDPEHGGHCATCSGLSVARTRQLHDLEAECERLRERVRVLEEALEWYADESNYDSDHAPGTPEPNVPREYAGWDADCGDRARAALAKGGE